jgi:hypothetical protein
MAFSVLRRTGRPAAQRDRWPDTITQFYDIRYVECGRLLTSSGRSPRIAILRLDRSPE